MITNIIEPTRGSAQMLGVDSRKLSPTEWQKIGYVSENQRLPEWMTLQQLIDYCRPLYPTWDTDLCEKLRKEFELPLDRKLKNMSRGMKVKAALLSSLAYRPQLLVLDEPFSGLDALVRDEFVRGILELSEQEKWTVFLSSHDIDEVERLADYVGIINNGQLYLQESTETLLARFQQVEVILQQSLVKLPANLPAGWLIPEMTGNVLRFVTSEFAGQSGAEDAIKRIVPEAGTISFVPLTLRNIFLALARTFRLQQSTSI
jgi:ABC-2 type transport system ATP-binding protein